MSGRDVTRALARFVVGSRAEDIPEAARHEAVRSLVNYLGCALAGARHDAVNIALAALAPFAGPPQAGLAGRRERLDCPHAALVNGMSAHVLDFDDTHLRTLMHPSVPVAPTLLALAERVPMTGADFLHAFVLGVDVECRIANSIYFAHNVDWYITGTAGPFGAAAAAGRVLGLDERGMARAFGIAASQAAGLREMAGTMCKSFVHGRAACNGMLAAFLAASGFTSSERALEAPRGFAGVLAPEHRLEEVTAQLGERYEIVLNTYKPYACGVVAHPVIDGCIALRNGYGLRTDDIAAVALRVHPLALKLTGEREPRSGLESKWSLYHSAAIALSDGAASEGQYTDGRVRDPAVARLRERVTAEPDAGLNEDEAYVRIMLRDGRQVAHHVEHAIGSRANPMSDRDLDRKFLTLSADALPAGRVEALLGKCWAVSRLHDVADIMRLAALDAAA
jgi:2-methylcitrate dehydratase PrpD